MSLLPNLDQMTDNEKLAVLESIQKSIAESKEIQKKKIGENVDLVVQALKKIESDIRDRFDAVGNSIEKRVLSIQDGRDGANGTDGRNGKDGKSGRDGLKGDRGVDGQAGRDGVDGVDGVSVVNAQIDFDGSLVITLSDGRELNVGEVVSADVAEKIKVISTMSTNGAVGIKDEGTSISTGVKTINFVGAVVTATSSGDDVTVNVSSGTGTVTSVAATAGTGISITGSPITTSGTLNITNTAPDQTVALTQGGTTTITGTYPNFTISSADQFQGTVTSVTGTSPVVSSGGATPAISLSANYGDTLNPYASKTANFVLAAPNGSAGVPTFRAVVAADIPTLNQSTTGSAATLTTPRAIYGNNFDGSAALTQVIASTYGGTGNGFTKFTGATTTERTYTLPDASSTIVVQGGALGTPSSGTVTNLTGTASININGTVGATTASTGAFTTLSATGVTTVQAGTAALPAITTSGDANTGIFFPAADTIAFSEGGAEAMRIDSSGNVGIGVTPSYRLEVKGPAATAGQLSIHDGTGDTVTSGNNAGSLLFQARDSSVRTIAEIDGVHTTTNGTGGAMVFQTRISDTLAERMRIDSSGNVGIGTSSPSFPLTVVTSSSALGIAINGRSSDNFGSMHFYANNGSTQHSTITASATEFRLSSVPAAAVQTFYTNGSERMRIDSSGNLLVGTTVTPTGATGGAGFIAESNARRTLLTATTTTSAMALAAFINPNGTVGTIQTSGSATSYVTSSDYRLKNTIAPMTGALAKVTLLKPCTYKWNIDNSSSQGFIAHELQEVVPDCVTGEKDAVETYTDEDGNEATRPAYQGIDTSFLVATLTSAIQEMNAIIDTQTSTITALTARITALEAK